VTVTVSTCPALELGPAVEATGASSAVDDEAVAMRCKGDVVIGELL